MGTETKVKRAEALWMEDASGKPLGTYSGPLRPGDKIVLTLHVAHTRDVDGLEILHTAAGIHLPSVLLSRLPDTKLVRDMALSADDWVVNGYIIKAADVPVRLRPCEVQDVISSNIFDMMCEAEVRDTVSHIKVLEADEARAKYGNPDDETHLISLGSTGRYIEL